MSDRTDGHRDGLVTTEFTGNLISEPALSVEQEIRLCVFAAIMGFGGYEDLGSDPDQFARDVVAAAAPLVAWVTTGEAPPAEPPSHVDSDGAADEAVD